MKAKSDMVRHCQTFVHCYAKQRWWGKEVSCVAWLLFVGQRRCRNATSDVGWPLYSCQWQCGKEKLDVGWRLCRQRVNGVGTTRRRLIVMQDKVDGGRPHLVLLECCLLSNSDVWCFKDDAHTTRVMYAYPWMILHVLVRYCFPHVLKQHQMG